MRLSIEVVDHILSFLQSDPVSLKACYESHPLLSQLAQRHRFTHVVLNDLFPPEFAFRPSDFSKVIHRHPHIATYVRSIELEVAIYPSELSSILPMMTLLKKVKLCGKLDPCWDEIPEHFRQAFLDCVHLPSMEDVSISQVSDFPLSALNNVKRLALEWEDESLLDTITLDDSGAHELQLESLSLIKFGCVSLQRVIAWVPPCTLRSLAILDCDALECLAPLFDKCSNSLTDLQLDLGPQCVSCFSMG